MVEILPIDTPSLGDRSYLAHDGDLAVVVDPQRDIDRITALAGRAGVRITHVVETHIHNDYVSGGLALSRAVGARYLVNAADPVPFAREPIGDGDVDRGRCRPAGAGAGHAGAHVHPPVLRAGVRRARWSAVFTGGSLLFGSTGRPDLLGPDNTDSAGPRAVRLGAPAGPRAARRRPRSCPPTGSAASARRPRRRPTSSTIGPGEGGQPGAARWASRTTSRTLLAGLDAYPAYYAHMGPANTAGPAGPDLSPPRRADPAELRRRIEAGEWVVDLRDRTAFAAGYLPGSFSFSLDRSFASYLGWVHPLGHPADPARRDTASRWRRPSGNSSRIGIDRPAAAATGQAGALDRRPAAGAPAAGHLRRPGHRPPAAPTSWSSTCGADLEWAERPRRRRRAHPVQRTARAGPARSRRARCGSTAAPATAPRSPRPCWPPRPQRGQRRRRVHQRRSRRAAPHHATTPGYVTQRDHREERTP